jgi:hypothetical protein
VPGTVRIGSDLVGWDGLQVALSPIAPETGLLETGGCSSP